MSKAAVNMYFVKLANELAPNGFTVIMFHPVSDTTCPSSSHVLSHAAGLRQDRHERRRRWPCGDIQGGIRGEDVGVTKYQHTDS